MTPVGRYRFAVTIGVLSLFGFFMDADAARPLVIVTSPAVKDAIEALGQAFERVHPDVRVQVAVDTSLTHARIAGNKNQGRRPTFITLSP